MKLTDPDVIKDGEKDLINAIEEDLDLDSINEIIKDKLKVKNLESKGGKIIVHNNKIAFKIDFELSMDGSVMFDRDGNYIPDDGENAIDDSTAATDTDDNKTDNVDEIGDKEKNEVDLDGTDDINEEIELDFSETEIEEDKEADADKEANKDKIDKEESDSEENDDKIAQELVVEDDLADDLDGSESSELDLDIEDFEDTEEDELDFSDDEDIDDILKESRDFWENKKGS